MDVVCPGGGPSVVRVRRHLVHLAGAPRYAKNPVDGEHTLYGFLTTEPNSVVRPVHSKGMRAILTNPAEFDAWLEGDVESALKLKRSLPADRLRVVALDQREWDGVGGGPQGQLALEG